MTKRKPRVIVMAYIGRTLLWAVALALLSLAAPFTGITLGTGILPAAALGALGLPGLALLITLQALF